MLPIFSTMKYIPGWLTALLFVFALLAAHAEDFPALCTDRAAIERVYHSHRLATQQTFEQAMPAAQIEQLVRLEQHKEAVLRRVYGVAIGEAAVETEVRRIDATTRAPEVLAEIKTALGGDAARFARAMARPIVVERALRARFENDDALHAPQRQEVEQLRSKALAAGGWKDQLALLKQSQGIVNETTWQLTPRPEAGEPDAVALLTTSTSRPSSSSSGAYTVEASVQLAQPLNPPAQERDRKCYFEELDPELQRVL